MSRKNWIYSYYQKIEDGSITVGAWIRLLYEKIIAELDSGKLKFDQKKANAAVDWIEAHCFHTEGPLAPKPLKLELWQKATLSCLYGLMDPETKTRQFRECVLIVARKNGKSALAAAIGRYEWFIGSGYGARIFCLAPKLEQADLVYRSIWNQTTLDPEWQQLRDAIDGSRDQHNKKQADQSMLAKSKQTELSIPGLNATVKKIAFSAKKSDGFNPSLTICDEIASWQGDAGLKQYEVMKSAMGARDMGDSPAIILSVSTSGYVNDSIYDELIKRSTRFLLGESKEKRLLPFLYIVDDPSCWNDLNELQKSNPNLGVSVSAKYLLDEIAIAEGSLSKKAEFLVKYCCVKQNSSLAWLPAEAVNKSMGEHLELEDFRNSYCVCGIDLSRTTDLTACTAVIEKNGRLNVFAQFFLPSERIDEATARDGVPYRAYIERGLLTPSGGNFVDYKDCFGWFRSLVEKYQIYPLRVGYDRYSAQYLVSDMSNYGFRMDDVYQGFNLSPVISECDGLIRDGAFNFGDNDLMKMHLLSTALKTDTDMGRRRIVKISEMEHIDGVASLLDAMTVRQKDYAEIGEQLKNE